MSQGAPAPQNYMGLAQQQAGQQNDLLGQQTQANRPNQQNAFGATSTWTTGPDGRPMQQTAFTGPLGQASGGVQQQLLQAMTGPLDFSSLPGVSSGDAARQQGIDAAYGQASSRLDPRFSRARADTRTQLLNQGLAEGSEAYNRSMGELGMQENDAYNQAMYSAIGQGREAGESIFRQDTARRGMGMQEMLQKRGQPLRELQGMQSLLGMQSFMGAGQGQAPNLLGAAGMQDAAAYRKWQADQQQLADWIGGGMDLLGTAGSFALSDERSKTDLQRLPEEMIPGVPLALWRYRDGMGAPGLHLGVVAQDLALVRPEAVRARHDGMFEVHPDFAPVALENP
jgi:hypothetical protein